MTKVPFYRIDIVSATAPTGPSVGIGTLWYDSSANKLNVHNGTSFQEYVITPELTAANVAAVDNFNFSTATNVQDVLDDVSSAIYDPLTIEHSMISGTHGPKVTIAQPGNDYCLLINKTDTNGLPAVSIQNAGGSGIEIQSAGDGLRINQPHPTSSSHALDINRSSNTGNSIQITHTSGSSAIRVSGTNGGGLHVESGGLGYGIHVAHSGLSAALNVQQHSTHTAANIEGLNTGSGDTMHVAHAGAGRALYVNHQNPLSISAGIDIDNASSGPCIVFRTTGPGYDVRGTDGNWRVNSDGSALFEGIQYNGNTVATKTIAGSVDAAGNPSVTGTGGWTSNKVSTGRYRVTFSDPFAGAPIVCATPSQIGYTPSEYGAMAINILSATHIELSTYPGGVITDRPFFFIAMGS